MITKNFHNKTTPAQLSNAYITGLKQQEVNGKYAQQADLDSIKYATLIVEHIYRNLNSRLEELTSASIELSQKFYIPVPEWMLGTSAKVSCKMAEAYFQNEGFTVNYSKSAELYDDDTHRFCFYTL